MLLTSTISPFYPSFLEGDRQEYIEEGKHGYKKDLPRAGRIGKKKLRGAVGNRQIKKKRFSEINFIENHKDVTNFIENIFSKKTRKLEKQGIKSAKDGKCCSLAVEYR